MYQLCISGRQLPARDVPDVDGRPVLHAQLPGSHERLGGGVDREGLVHVVGGAAAAVEQGVDGAVRADEVDGQVTAVGVDDVDVDLGGRGGVALAAGDGHRGLHGRPVVGDVHAGVV